MWLDEGMASWDETSQSRLEYRVGLYGGFSRSSLSRVQDPDVSRMHKRYFDSSAGQTPWEPCRWWDFLGALFHGAEMILPTSTEFPGLSRLRKELFHCILTFASDNNCRPGLHGLEVTPCSYGVHGHVDEECRYHTVSIGRSVSNDNAFHHCEELVWLYFDISRYLINSQLHGPRFLPFCYFIIFSFPSVLDRGDTNTGVLSAYFLAKDLSQRGHWKDSVWKWRLAWRVRCSLRR